MKINEIMKIIGGIFMGMSIGSMLVSPCSGFFCNNGIGLISFGIGLFICVVSLKGINFNEKN